MKDGKPVNWVHEYQQMRDDRDRWKNAAEMLFIGSHDGGCPASISNRKLQMMGEWPIGYDTDCVCGFDAYEKAVRGE